MKNRFFLILLFVSGLLLFQACDEKPQRITLRNKVDTASYIIGLDYGISIKEEEIEVNEKAIYNGLLDGLSGNSLLSDSLKDKIIDRYNTELNIRREEKERKILEKTEPTALLLWL